MIGVTSVVPTWTGRMEQLSSYMGRKMGKQLIGCAYF